MARQRMALLDAADAFDPRAEAAGVAAHLRSLADLIAVHRPDLWRGESLFAEYDSYDLAGLRHDEFHRLENELEILQRKLVGSMKFSRLHKYQAADLLYLVTESGIAQARPKTVFVARQQPARANNDDIKIGGEL